MDAGQDDEAEKALLHKVSLRTKALIVANEFTHGSMSAAEFRRMFLVLAPTADEQTRLGHAIEEELQAARYPTHEIVNLIGILQGHAADDRPLMAPAGAGPGSPRDPNVIVTRKVRSPSLMPFESYEFKSETPAPSSNSPSKQTNVARRLRFASGGETEAGFEASALKGLAKKKQPEPAARQVVLVADDDARSRMMYRAKLEEGGFTVMEAKDGIEAWNHIRSGAVQCAVMDMKMPGYHGLEVLSRMVDSNLILPVVVVSAFDQLANEFVVATYPKLTFLPKPAPPEQVLEAVRGYLRSAEG